MDYEEKLRSEISVWNGVGAARAREIREALDRGYDKIVSEFAAIEKIFDTHCARIQAALKPYPQVNVIVGKHSVEARVLQKRVGSLHIALHGLQVVVLVQLSVQTMSYSSTIDLALGDEQVFYCNENGLSIDKARSPSGSASEESHASALEFTFGLFVANLGRLIGLELA